MKTVPTAEEFIKDNPRNPKMQWKLTQLMIEFAKLHVEAALESAAKNAEAFCNYERDFLDGTADVDAHSILNAYPKELIK